MAAVAIYPLLLFGDIINTINMIIGANIVNI